MSNGEEDVLWHDHRKWIAVQLAADSNNISTLFAPMPSTQPLIGKGPGWGMSAARMRNWRVTGGNDMAWLLFAKVTVCDIEIADLGSGSRLYAGAHRESYCSSPGKGRWWLRQERRWRRWWEVAGLRLCFDLWAKSFLNEMGWDGKKREETRMAPRFWPGQLGAEGAIYKTCTFMDSWLPSDCPLLFLTVPSSVPWRVGTVGRPGKWCVWTTVTTWLMRASVTQIISQKPRRTARCHRARARPQTGALVSTLSRMRATTPGASAPAGPTCSGGTSGGPAPGEQWVLLSLFLICLLLPLEAVLGVQWGMD